MVQLDKALEELSKDIYCSSLDVGPEHISTSPGYFFMADVLYAQRKVCRRFFVYVRCQLGFARHKY
jgi:hypothetical protein